MSELNRAVTDMSSEEYHALDRLSSGGVKQMLRSPAHFRAWKDTPQAPTAAMMFGTAVHTMTLEPSTVAQRIAVMPADAPTRQSNAGKDWHLNFQREAAGKIILSADDYKRAARCASAVFASPAWGLVSRNSGIVEASLLWMDMQSGVPCKARPDLMSADGMVCFDLKTTANAAREDFARQLWNLRYDIQAAFYMDGMHATNDVMPAHFVWACVEVEPPHGVAWYRMGHSDLEIARADIHNAAYRYAQCKATDTWPGYPDAVQEIRLPAWARGKREPSQTEF